MKTTKRVLAIALATMMVAGLAACGTSASSAAPAAPAAPPASAPASASTATPTEEPSGTVVVYSPHDADPLNAGVNEFMAKYPKVKVEIVAAGTGELCNRIKAESASPIADVLWGGGADSLAAFKDYFAPYVCANDAVIADAYKDADDKWIGESPLPMVIFYNKKMLDDQKLAIPQSWEDLTKPEYKGQIAYCLPSKSGSAYTQLCTMILGKGGKEEGWKFIEKLYKNLDGKMVDSSSKCHKMVKDGEFAIGLTLEKAAVQYKEDYVGFVYPTDGTSAVPDGVCLVKGAPNEANAKLFIDYVTSAECQTNQSKNWGRRPVRNDIEVAAGMPKLADIKLMDYDFEWAATNKETIIEKFNEIMVG